MSPNGPRHLVRAPDTQAGPIVAEAPVISSPRNRTEPSAGGNDPARTFNERRLAGPVGADDAYGFVGPNAEVDAVQHRKRAEALTEAGGVDNRCVVRAHEPTRSAAVWPAAVTLGSLTFSMMTQSKAKAPVPLTHWPPRIGVATTLGTGPVPQVTLPNIVSTERVGMTAATAALSFGFPLALSAAMPTSTRDALLPSI